MALKTIFCFVLFFSSSFVLAGAGGGIPLWFVFFQALNFLGFAFCFYYLLRKKVPPILKQKKQDFLDYRDKAKELEKEHKTTYDQIQHKLKGLIKKEQNLKQTVDNALKKTKEELEKNQLEWMGTQKKLFEQELKRQRLKEISSLKDKVLSQVLKQTKVEIEKKETPTLELLNKQIITKWDKKT